MSHNNHLDDRRGLLPVLFRRSLSSFEMTIVITTFLYYCYSLQFKGVFEHFITYFVRFISFLEVMVY